MGILVSHYMDESMKKQQQFMQEAQKLQVERLLQMQNMMLERQIAIQIARNKDLAYNIILFTGTMTAVCIGKALKTKNELFLMPTIPLLFITNYWYDLGYGNKVQQIKRAAEKLLNSESDLIRLPNGALTYDQVEARRILSPKGNTM